MRAGTLAEVQLTARSSLTTLRRGLRMRFEFRSGCYAT